MIHQTDDTQANIVPEEDAPRTKTKRALTTAQARGFGLIAPTAAGKNFVLDTNVLLHDPGCLVDALLNTEVSLVTCYGQAGTGKTLVAIAAGLNEVFGRRYNGLTVSRPVVSMGDQLGYLPGTLDEKMRPWLQPVYDALDLLTTPPVSKGPRRKQSKKEGGALVDHGAAKPYE